jgi:hypothetical protein
MSNVVLNPVDCSGRRVDSSENANAFSSCVGRFKEAQSMSCGLSWSDETPQEQSDEEAQRQPRGKRGAWNENQQPSLTAKQIENFFNFILESPISLIKLVT